jgi:hypothetical protein
LVSDTLRAVLAALGCVLGSLGNHGHSQGSKDQTTWSPPALACWSLELIMTDFWDHRIVEHEEGFNSWSTSFVWTIDIFPRYLFLLINVSNSMNHLSSNIFIPRMLQLQMASISVHQYFQGRLLSSPPQPNRRALVFTALLKGYLMLRKLLYGDRTSWKPLKSLQQWISRKSGGSSRIPNLKELAIWMIFRELRHSWLAPRLVVVQER